MHDDADFLRAILADPFDDAPRLLLADWLEENSGSMQCPVCRGNRQYSYRVDGGGVRFRNPCDECRGTGRIPDHRAARAEFIRVQCEYDRLFCLLADSDDPYETSCNNTECRRCHLERIARRIIHDPLTGRGWQNEWSYPCLALLNDSLERFDEYVEFRRGFVFRIYCTLTAFQQHAAEIFSRHPVTEVRLTDREPNRRHIGWYGRISQYTTDELPIELWEHLRDYGRKSGGWKWYPTPPAAHAALSPAAVDLGRSLAGLPTLTWPAVRENELSGISG